MCRVRGGGEGVGVVQSLNDVTQEDPAHTDEQGRGKILLPIASKSDIL